MRVAETVHADHLDVDTAAFFVVFRTGALAGVFLAETPLIASDELATHCSGGEISSAV